MIDNSAAVKYLGKTCKDVITGATGICNAILLQFNGNIMVGIMPAIAGDSTQEAKYHDVNTVDIIDNGISDRVVQPNSGGDFTLGAKVKDRVSGFKGTITSASWFVSGCIQFSVVSDKTDKDTGRPVEELLLSDRLEIVKTAAIKEVVQTRTGGPSHGVTRKIY